MINPQPDETDLGVYQSVDMENGITLRQCSERTLELIASNGADRTTIHDVDRECAKKLITALQRWLDTGGFYAEPKDDDEFGQKRQRAIELLDSWIEDDDDEQRDTLDYLKRALDEDRLSDRKLFPENETSCQCRQCITERGETLKLLSTMILCPICGNKRCPHANNHMNRCTHSNDTGQPGSAYP